MSSRVRPPTPSSPSSRHVAVEPAVGQDLAEQSRMSPVPGPQGDERRQGPACAVAEHRDPVRQHADLGGVRGHPLGGGPRVLDLAGRLVLGSEVVVHRDHPVAGLGRQHRRQRSERVVAAHHHAAAVQVDEARQLGVRGRAVDADRHGPVPARNLPCRHVRHLRQVRGVRHRLQAGPHGIEPDLTHGAGPTRPALFHEGGQIGIGRGLPTGHGSTFHVDFVVRRADRSSPHRPRPTRQRNDRERPGRSTPSGRPAEGYLSDGGAGKVQMSTA
jgi:hypothetical protein